MDSETVSSGTETRIKDADFPWHIRCALIVVLLITVAGCISLWRSDTSVDLTKAAAATVWTTYSVGNPSTVHFANVRASRLSENVLCGRINYEKAENGGWSGYTDFYVEKGVMYISPPTGKFFKTFSDYCLVLPTPTP